MLGCPEHAEHDSLYRMSRRHPVLRMLVMVGAAIQLLSPGVAAIADGLLARESAAQPLTHIEASTSAKCSVVHAPDCGVCRYLSSASSLPRLAPPLPVFEAALPLPRDVVCASASVVTSLPDGRAPPAL